MTAQPLVMAKPSSSDLIENDVNAIPFKTGSMHIDDEEYRVKLYEHIPLDTKTWKPTQFDPNKEWTDIEIKTQDGRIYWGNVEAIDFLNDLFEQNKNAGQQYHPVYLEQTLTSVVRCADISTVTAYFRIIIGELGIETLCAQRKLKCIKPEDKQEKSVSGKAYKKYRAAYHARFANALVPVNFPDYFDPYNGRVAVQLKTVDSLLTSQFVSVGYLNRILKEHQETGKIIIDHKVDEIYTPHGIHIPFFVILREINQDTISQTIDALIKKFDIEYHFTK